MAGAFRNVVRDSRQKLEHSAEIKEEPILFSTARPFKAILAVMIVLVVCYGMFVPASYAFADETNGATAELTDEQKSASVIQLERVNANLPIVKVYLQLDNSAPFSAGDVIATLGDKPLLPESLSSLEDAGEGTTYFFLVDCSTSIFQADMDGVKQMLDAFVNNKGSLDRIVLIAFGERVDVLLDGGEDSQTAIERINILAPTQQATLFNDAVIKALDLAETEQANLPERKVIIVVSDGINYDEAAGSTEQEVLGRLDSASVPLYAICLPSADSGANPQAFGQLARKSGGDIRMAEGANISSEFLAMNSHISAIKVLTLQASNNIIESPEQQLAISISLGDRVIVNGGTRTVTVKSHIPDSEAPVILRAEQLDESRIKIYFSEPVFNAEKMALM